jgi:hypothetical protein
VTRFRAILAAVTLTAGLALAITPGTPAQAVSGHRSAAPAAVRLCATEDSPGPCLWDAAFSGNGHGRSFLRRADGRVRYLPPRPLTWHRVMRDCRLARSCHLVPGWLRHDLRLGRHRALVRWGDTTVIWVRLPGGRVRVITS